LKSFLKLQFELQNASRIIPMEGLRGFAAILVFFVHFYDQFGAYIINTWVQSIMRFMASIGHAGVDLFFVLSGFLIYGIMMNRQFHFVRYLLRRIQRLYPIFIAVLAIYLILFFILPEHSKLSTTFNSTILYIMANLAMLPGMIKIEPIIAVAWSLSYEWFFYLIMPMLMALLSIRRWKSCWRASFFMLMAIAYWISSTLGWVHHPRLILFTAGILLWELWKSNNIHKGFSKWGELAAIIAFVCSLALIGMSKLNSGPVELILSKVPHYYAPFLFITLFFLVAFGLFFKGILFSVFSWAPLRWVGNMSYSYYLIHGLVLHGLNYFFRIAIKENYLNTLMLLIMLLISIAITLASAGILYLAIEKPLSISK
jgi:exopolysaccharide production protein ExoZ